MSLMQISKRNGDNILPRLTPQVISQINLKSYYLDLKYFPYMKNNTVLVGSNESFVTLSLNSKLKIKTKSLKN